MRNQFAILALAAAALSANAGAQLFSNPAPITINDAAAATPYPSNIAVSGTGTILTNITVTLSNMNHTWPDDIDALLVGPNGGKILILSDAGGSTDIVNVTASFNDAASGMVPDGGPMTSGLYKPSNYDTTSDTFPAGPPVGPYPATSLMAVFGGSNPNGTWSLYVRDDAGADVGNISGGWSIEIAAVPEPATMASIGAGVLALFARRRRK